jgi:hypothetical protein
MLRRNRYGFNKKSIRHIVPNLCFYMWGDMWVT